MSFLMAQSVHISKVHKIRSDSDQMVEERYPKRSHLALAEEGKVGTGKEHDWDHKPITEDAIHHISIVGSLDKLLIEALGLLSEPGDEFCK